MMNINMTDGSSRELSFRDLNGMQNRLLSRTTLDKIMMVLKAGAVEMRNDIILSMRNTPKAAPGLNGSSQQRYGRVYKRGKKYHTASIPGFPPAVDRGNLIKSILMKSTEDTVEVGSYIANPPYGFFLEYGTRKMKARPWLGPVVAKWEPKLKREIARVLTNAGREELA